VNQVAEERKRPRRISGWSAFSVIGLLGTLLAFSFLSFAGPFAWPFILILGAAVIWVRPPARAWFGLISGIGAFLLFIAAIHLADAPCDTPAGIEALRTSGSCGGLDSKPWLIVGALVFALGFGLYLWARRRVMKTERP